ncbi:MAG: DUF6262 family protein [Nostoc sp. DedQUE01]|nr:DUF6262 family protein [Nostoc sp. DedQUE01]
MKHERNIDGLRRNAQKKKEEALQRTCKAIQQLISEARPINFKTVSEVAGVSTAWLYKEEQIKERIENLREQGIREQKLVDPKQQVTNTYHEPKYLVLKNKFQAVEAENHELRTQNQELHNQLEASYTRERALANENEAKQSKIDRLTKLLSETQAEIERLK